MQAAYLETHVQDALLQRSDELGALLQVTEAGEQADWQTIEAVKKALPALDLLSSTEN